MKIESKFISDSFLRVTLDFLSRGSFFLINFWIARKLGKSGFGQYSTYISLVQIFYVLTDLGISLKLIKEMGVMRVHGDKSWVQYLYLKAFLLVFVTGVFVLFFGFREIHFKYLFYCFVWMLGNSVLDFNQYICNGLGRMDLAQKQVFLQRFFLFMVVGLTLYYAPSLENVTFALFLGTLVSVLISNVFFIKSLKIPKWPSIHWSGFKSILLSSFPNAISTLFSSWYLRLGVVLIAWGYDKEVVASFAAPYKLFEAVYIIPAGIMSLAIPHIAESIQKGQEFFYKELGVVSSLMGLLGAMGGVLLFFLSPFIIKIVYGSQYASSVHILKILSFVSIFVFVNMFLTSLMVVFELQKKLSLNYFFAFVFSALLNSFLIDKYGAAGAAYALLLTESILFLFVIRAIQSNKKIVWSAFVRTYKQ